MDIMNIKRSDRQKKYFTEVDVDSKDRKNKTEGKITVIKDGSQKISVGNGISIFALELKTSIEFSKSNEKFIHPVLNALKKQGKFPWNRTYQGSSITARIGKLKDTEIEELKDLIEKIIRL